jgi:hypothetical protein
LPATADEPERVLDDAFGALEGGALKGSTETGAALVAHCSVLPQRRHLVKEIGFVTPHLAHLSADLVDSDITFVWMRRRKAASQAPFK